MIALAAIDETASIDVVAYGDLQRTEASRNWLAVHAFNSGWAPQTIGQREASLLESEWVLRLAIIGTPFVRSLIEIAEKRAGRTQHLAAVSELLEALKTFHGPGTYQLTREGYKADLEALVAKWPVSGVDVEPFWAQGLTRSRTYETALKQVLKGFDTSSESFLTYRPDYVVQPYRPCSVVEAVRDDPEAITAAIRRDAHVFEFTALNAYSDVTVRNYLAAKLPNYVQVTQEQ